MRKLVLAVLFVLCANCALQPSTRRQELAPEGSSQPACMSLGKTYTRTTLYFGLSRPAGTISERQWQAFLRDEVTPRFPDGLTVWEASGQWKRPNGHIRRKRAKVLLGSTSHPPPWMPPSSPSSRLTRTASSSNPYCGKPLRCAWRSEASSGDQIAGSAAFPA